MQATEYTISVANANHAISKMHRLLSSRNVKLKRSDLKEVVAELLSFNTSNALDAKIKDFKQTRDALSIFDKSGALKDNPRVVFKRFKTGIEAHKFFHKYTGFKSVMFFEERFVSESGFTYEIGDFLFAADKMDAAQVLFTWAKNAKLEYRLYDDDESASQDHEGRWQFELNGDDLMHSLNRTSMKFDVDDFERDCDGSELNRKRLERDILDELLLLDLPFSDVGRQGCKEMIEDWLLTDFSVEYMDVVDVESYTQLIERYVPCFPIQILASMEAYGVPTHYLPILKNFGARLDDHDILLSAASGGRLDNCDYLLAQGNSVEAFYRVDMSDSAHCAFHDQIILFLATGDANLVVPYLRLIKALEVDVAHEDHSGQSVMHAIAGYGDIDLYKKCEKLGCDIFALNQDGFTSNEILQKVLKQNKGEIREQAKRVCH